MQFTNQPEGVKLSVIHSSEINTFFFGINQINSFLVAISLSNQFYLEYLTSIESILSCSTLFCISGSKQGSDFAGCE